MPPGVHDSVACRPAAYLFGVAGVGFVRVVGVVADGLGLNVGVVVVGAADVAEVVGHPQGRRPEMLCSLSTSEAGP